jgi:hypothetical protein
MTRRIVEHDGKLVLFGYGFTDRLEFKLTRVNADGSIDPSFNQKAIFRHAGGVQLFKLNLASW